MTYAGFWKRVAASLIDTFVTLIVIVPVSLVMGILMGTSGADRDFIELSGNILGLLVGWFYYTFMESSKLQGTVGKIALGIEVTDLDGNQISFGKANGRYFCKIISTIILMIGYIMVAFTEKKQGLHDMMAGCLVVNK